MINTDVPINSDDTGFIISAFQHLPVCVSINQMDDLDDPQTNHNIWANKSVYDFIGYTREEIDQMGMAYFLETMHPDDLQIISSALLKFEEGNDKLFSGLVRIKPKNGKFHWFIGSIVVMETKQGKPWRFLVVALNIEHMQDTPLQLMELTKENLRLRNQIKIQLLTRRELEVIKLIAGNCSDLIIAKKLFISPATARTHRNNIKEKLMVHNTAGIVQFAFENGLS